MSILDLFRRVPEWSVLEARAFVEGHDSGEYNLVDVRRPGEYEEGHLPGAKLMPLADLKDRLEELDRTKPTVTYCRAGVRSRSGAAILLRAGFEDVHSMTGGIQAWHGAVASGAPEFGSLYFVGAAKPEELIALAWMMENGSERFYNRVVDLLSDEPSRKLFTRLAETEAGHKANLETLYEQVSGAAPGPRFAAEVLGEAADPDIMEGRVRLSEALDWARGKSVTDILGVALTMEANGYDLYVTLAGSRQSPDFRKLFADLAEQEKGHMTELGHLLDFFQR